MFDRWAQYSWTTESHGYMKRKENLCLVIERRAGFMPLVKDPDWFRHSNIESLKSVGRRAKPTVGPRKFIAHKKTHEFCI